MTPAPHSIALIEAAISKVGAVEFARRSGVPYTTIREWKARQWRAKVFDTFDALTTAAQACLSESQDAA